MAIKPSDNTRSGVFIVYSGDGSGEKLSKEPKYTGPKWKCLKFIEEAPKLGIWNAYKIVPVP